MKSSVRLLLILPVLLVFTACLDATAPRLPPGEKEGSDSTKEGQGYRGPVQSPLPIG